MWHSDDACFDDDGGDVGGGRGRLWEEMEGVLWRMCGRDLHGRESRRKEREQGESEGPARGCPSQVKSVYVTCTDPFGKKR